MNSRERVIAMMEGQPVDRLPVMPITMMFAADRIGARYVDYETDYRVLVEGQLKVSEDFGLDYVNTMSDPACEAADLGANVVFPENLPASLKDTDPFIKDKSQLLKMRVPDPTQGRRMSNRLQALALFRERVGGEKLIEGWVEGPIAEAADLRGMNNIMTDMVDDPQFVEDLFAFCVEMEVRFAEEQLKAGADLIGIGDAAASLVGPRFYRELVWPYEKRLVDGIAALNVPGRPGRTRLHICGNTRRILEGMGKLGCAIVDLDFLAPMAEGRAAMGPDQVLLGNVDPVRVLRQGTPEDVTRAVEECHLAAGPKYIVGAGCEIVRDTPEENFRALVRYAHEHKASDIPNVSGSAL